MSKPQNTGDQVTETRKRRREWLIALGTIALVALSLRYQGRLFDLTAEIPLSGNILVLALINLNILLITHGTCLSFKLMSIYWILHETSLSRN